MAPKQNPHAQDNTGAKKETEKVVEDSANSKKVQSPPDQPSHKAKAVSVIPAPRRSVKMMMLDKILKLVRVSSSLHRPPSSGPKPSNGGNLEGK